MLDTEACSINFQGISDGLLADIIFASFHVPISILKWLYDAGFAPAKQ
jgi:hypothetical protein